MLNSLPQTFKNRETRTEKREDIRLKRNEIS